MKKISKFLFAVCGCALATTMVMAPVAGTAQAASNIFTVNTGVVETTVDFSSAFVVPAAPSGYEVKVTAPNGEVVTPDSENKVTAGLLGHYTVEYTNTTSGVSYSYTVFSSNDKTYAIEVNDTVIPSYLAVGETASLPTASVYYTDDKGEKVYLDGVEVQPIITGYFDADGNVAYSAEADGKTKFNAIGAAKVSYVHKVGTGVYASADYEIRVQQDFADTTAPSLSVSGWKETANINMEYTLPVAKATDNYDSRVNVKVTVTDPDNNPVKAYPVDENGYAYVEDGQTYEDVKFDNKNVVKFYPVKKGIYKVVYEATDDAGNSAKKIEKIINVSDLKGPTINVDRASIPQNWGYKSVGYKNGDSVVTLSDTKIFFPLPTYYDNNAEAELDVSLRLRNAEGDEVFKVTGIQNFDTLTNLPENVTKADNGFYFDVNAYITALAAEKADTQYAVVGTYSAQYTVVEKSTGSTTSTALYQINIKEDYVDENVVEIGANADVEKNVVLGVGDKFTLPVYDISSKSDSDLIKTYTISNGTADMNYNEFVGGEVLELIEDNGQYFLVYTEDEVEVARLELVAGENTLTYKVGATADSGANKQLETDSTTVIVKTVSPKTYAVTTTEDAEGKVTALSIDLATAGVENKHVGVEVGLRDADGNYKSFKATLYYNAYTNAKVIDDIVYPTVSVTANHYLEVRVFDIYGTSTVNVYEFELKAAQVTPPVETDPSLSFSNTVTLGNSIAWANEKLSFAPSALEGNRENVYLPIARVIEGGRFSTMGNEFTPLTATTYTITDKAQVIVKNAFGSYTAGQNVTEDYPSLMSKVNTVKVTSNTAKTISLNEPMPLYLAKNSTGSAIPNAVVYDSEKNYDVTIEVTDPQGNTKTLDSTYTFTSDGSYTIKYLVADSAVSTFSVKVGDNSAPQFNVTSKPASKLSKGASIKFSAVTLPTGSSEDISKLTFTKTVYDASGNVVGKQLTGDGSSWASKTGDEIKLSSAGEYTVVYSVMDKAGNESVQKFTIMVSENASATTVDANVVGTVIVIVIVVLIAGIVVYTITSAKKKKED